MSLKLVPFESFLLAFYTSCPEKKVPLIFLLYLLQILTDFHNFSCDDGVVQLPPLPQQTFFQLLHARDPRATLS